MVFFHTWDETLHLKLFGDTDGDKQNLSSGGNRVNVNFYDGRLNINNWNDDSNDNIGLASSRNFRLDDAP